MEKLLFDTDNDVSISQSLKALTVKDAIDLLSKSWEMVSNQTIFNCWKNILKHTDIYKNFKFGLVIKEKNWLIAAELLLQKLLRITNPTECFTKEEISEWIYNQDEDVLTDFLTSKKGAALMQKEEENESEVSNIYPSYDKNEGVRTNSARQDAKKVVKCIDQLEEALIAVGDTDKQNILKAWRQEYVEKTINLM